MVEFREDLERQCNKYYKKMTYYEAILVEGDGNVEYLQEAQQKYDYYRKAVNNLLTKLEEE